MSGVLIYSEKEAKRNTFAINKFKEELGVTLAINDYNGTADFIINRTNNYKIAEKFEKKGYVFLTPPPSQSLQTTSSFATNLWRKTALKFYR